MKRIRNVPAIIAGLFVAVGPGIRAQQIVTLIPFDAIWRYDQSGTDFGSAWRTNTYDDSIWEDGGQGLLQGGETTIYPAPFHTTILSPLEPAGTTRVTDYFRTSFLYSGTTNGVTLYATNLVDDGAAIYLNGMPAGLIRIGANPIYTTLATGGPPVEGLYDVVTIDPTLLRPGQDNVIAVEVHQNAVGSSDVVWGMRLVSYQSTALTITQQPQSQTVSAPRPVTFSVSVSGGPVTYQWQKDQVNILNATNNTFIISSTTLASAGTYRVIVSNSVSRVVSSDAVLTMFADTAGPTMLSATLQYFGITNVIDLAFDEAPLTSTANTNNIRVIQSGTFGASAVSVIVSNIQVSGRVYRLRVGGPNWNLSQCYYILANGVRDQFGNSIAINSVVGVTMSPGDTPCAVPTDGPLEQLRVSILRNGDLAWISWPTNSYYGFSLVRATNLTPQVLDQWQWRAVPNQTNNYLIRVTNVQEFFGLRK